MISYLGPLVQFSPAAGRAGHCRQMSLCVGSTRRDLARQPAVLAPSPRELRAFSLCGERPGQPGVCVALSQARCAFSLCGERARQPEDWRPFPWCGAPFPSAACCPGSQRFGALSTGAPRLGETTHKRLAARAARRGGKRHAAPGERAPKLLAAWPEHGECSPHTATSACSAPPSPQQD